MSFAPILRGIISPLNKTIIRYTRSTRSSMKVGHTKFQLTLDLRQYNKDELSVKAHSKYVVIEGKQERKTSEGIAIRQFVKKYRLPEGCIIKNMESTLTSDGILTITAPRIDNEPEFCEITEIPIRLGFSKRKETLPEKKKERVHYCSTYPNVKPKTKT